MTNRLREAFDSEPIPPGLAARVSTVPKRGRRPWWTWPALAAAAAAVAFGVTYLQKMRTVDSILAAAEPALHSILRVGLRDHVYCAVMRKYSSKPKPVEKLAEDLPEKMRDLATVVRAKVPAEYQLHVAHVCKFKGRSYVHLALHNGEKLVSVMLTAKQGGEAITRNELLSVTSQAGIDVFSGGSHGFEVAVFEKREWLVFLVSDLSGSQHRELMLSMAPAVRDFLDRV